MTFNSLSNVLQTGLVSKQTPVDDTADLDGDASTDKYILVAWADLAGNWPNQALPHPCMSPTSHWRLRFSDGD